MTEAEKQVVQGVLKPLADIWVAYQANNLDDEARRFWGENHENENQKPPKEIELYTGRGGGMLLNLAHCKDAFDLLAKL